MCDCQHVHPWMDGCMHMNAFVHAHKHTKNSHARRERERKRESARAREKERERDLHTGSSNHVRNMRRNNSEFQRALH